MDLPLHEYLYNVGVPEQALGRISLYIGLGFVEER